MSVKNTNNDRLLPMVVFLNALPFPEILRNFKQKKRKKSFFSGVGLREGKEKGKKCMEGEANERR